MVRNKPSMASLHEADMASPLPPLVPIRSAKPSEPNSFDPQNLLSSWQNDSAKLARLQELKEKFPGSEDYPFQLMLQEQDNKKRLLAARKQQESDSQSTQRSQMSSDGKVKEGNSGKRDERLVELQEQIKAHENKSDNLLQVLTTMRDEMKAAFTEHRQEHSAPVDDHSKAQLRSGLHGKARVHTKPFTDFMTNNPTVFHAVDALKTQLKDAGFEELRERDVWSIKPSGRYLVERNGSSIIAFAVGNDYKPGNGAAIVAGHIDALTAKLKPISAVPNKAGFLQLGVAPYAGGLNSTWWDRDLGIGGRVLVKEGGKIVSKLVKLDWPIARVPTLAPHFGAAVNGPFNLETQMVPIIGLEGSDSDSKPFGTSGTFTATQPPKLVQAIAKQLGLTVKEYGNIINWELELFDVQPATTGGLDKENPDFIYAGRIDDKLCSWAAVQALLQSQAESSKGSLIKVVACFDNEEIGSLTRQGARGNFLPATLERAVESLTSRSHAANSPSEKVSEREIFGRTYANSFMVSSDVCHAVNPNFLNVYLENHAPKLNVGVAMSGDSNGHMTTDAVSAALFQRCVDKSGATLQWFQIRNDSRSGGTVGPMLSSAMGMRAIDAGIPQLSMHSIRATTGSLDPGLGVITFHSFLENFEAIDAEFGGNN